MYQLFVDQKAVLFGCLCVRIDRIEALKRASIPDSNILRHLLGTLLYAKRTSLERRGMRTKGQVNKTDTYYRDRQVVFSVNVLGTSPLRKDGSAITGRALGGACDLLLLLDGFLQKKYEGKLQRINTVDPSDPKCKTSEYVQKNTTLQKVFDGVHSAFWLTNVTLVEVSNPIGCEHFGGDDSHTLAKILR